ncbi:MAG TPA: DUF6048 family protein [Bacteroidales bacterium]|nr:DUF6048 family protein [Bacteroidales bacterium]
MTRYFSKISVSVVFMSIFSLANIGFAQIVKKDTVQKRLSIGIDIAKPVIYMIDKNKFEVEGSISYSNINNFNPIVEFGLENVELSQSDTIKTYEYQSDGKFFRIGFDYNTFRRNLFGENNMVFFGFRYGYANQNHSAKNIIINDKFWPKRYTSLSTQEIQTHWLELTSGIKVQFFKYFAAGWTVRFSYIIDQQNTSSVKPYYIPGIGKGAEKYNFGFTYSLYYTFPL